jgi:uncharacterized protein
MNNIGKIKEVIQSERKYMDSLGIKRAGVFGSYIRGEATESSDVDILIELEENSTLTLFSLIELEQKLVKKLNTNVDIVIKRDLKKYICSQIIKEVQYVQ